MRFGGSGFGVLRFWGSGVLRFSSDGEFVGQREQGGDAQELRGGSVPSVVGAVRVCVDAGAPGITVHPRADERHIRGQDVFDIADELAPLRGRVEFNIEGDPRADLIDLVLAVRPDQCTLVPVLPGEITSQAGWSPDTPADALGATVERIRSAGVRVSIFVDPEEAPIRWARRLGADRVELYTEPFARAFERGPDAAAASFERCARAAQLPATGPRCQRRSRPRPPQPDALPPAAAPRRGLDRPRLDRPCPVRRAAPRGQDYLAAVRGGHS